MSKVSKALIAFTALLILNVSVGGTPDKAKSKSEAKETGEGPAVLWREPADIASRNLYYGPGGKAHEPQGTFTFDKEDMNGTTPKFDVIDQSGARWTVKLGCEARPETVASRLVWAAGYFANEDYFMPVIRVQNMQRLHRGKNLVSADGTAHNVRLKRRPKEHKKIGIWSWANNPFTDTREWYGLRVLMAIINNWDLKDQNNAVVQVRGDHPEQIYLVSDLGASFGTTSLSWTPDESKGNLKAYSHSKWIKHISPQYIDFNVPSLPALDNLFSGELEKRVGLVWVGRHSPRAEAKWMGHQLAQLSPDQIRDAFRAAGYSAQEVDSFAQVLMRRIGELENF
jgi:hypothetical protein